MHYNRKVSVLFATQTGNSEDVAERIGRSLSRIHCMPYVRSISDYPITQLVQESVVILICSTTGDGEFPDTMKSFWKFLLRKNLPNDSLKELKFCVFGLGDSSYDRFNIVAKKLNKRFLQLGAIELISLTLGDDQHELGYDAALDPWILKLKDSLLNLFCITEPIIPANVALPPKYIIKFIELSEKAQIDVHDWKTKYSIAKLKFNNRITAIDHFQAVHLLKFDIDDDVVYTAGDVAVVWPENPEEETQEFLDLFDFPSESYFILQPQDLSVNLPKLSPYPCTFRQCAKSYFDFMSIPRRSFFELLYLFSTDELEAEKLQEFTTASGQEELYDYCNRPRRTILEVLKDFPHTTPKVPFEYLFDMIPPIRPRSFSISSSLSAHPNELHLLIAVVEYKTRLKKPRKGICSNWLKDLKLGTAIPFYTKKGSISLPENKEPIIMIGPGTGCAPFKSFIEERSLQNIQDNYLFFGNRYRNKDFLFNETWSKLSEKGYLKLFTAFSRDQENKIYVQHKILENKQLLWDLICNKNSLIYVAGNAKQMPQGVKEAFVEICQVVGKMNNETSLKFIQNLQNSRRYQVETWA